MNCGNCKKYEDCMSGSGLTWPCGAYVPKIVTNADRIRSMNDAELAKAINLLVEGEPMIQYCRSLPECDEDLEQDTVIPLERCEKCVLHWLQQPVKEDTTC